MFPARNAVVKSLALLLLLARDLPAKETEMPAGRIVFSAGGQLQEIPAAGGTAAARGALPSPATRMEATQDGTLVVVEMGGKSIWLVKGAPAEKECAGRARPSPRGECLACLEAGGVRLLQPSGALIRQLPAGLRDVNFYGPSSPELVALSAEGVVAFSPAAPDKTRLLAKPGPSSHLLVAPDGGRGVAIMGEKNESRIFSFALDGRGVPRQLGGPGVPIAWSWDSQWVLVQEGLPPEDEGGEEARGSEVDRFLLAAPKKGKKKNRRAREKDPLTRACAMRAVGGEAKCWNHYDGVAFSPDSRHVLLRKDGSLYLGRIAGVKAEKPKLLVEKADPGAAWLP